jgi:hypothetical protein
VSLIIKFLDFVHHLMFQKNKTVAFQKLDVYILRWKSGEACADWLHQKDLLAITGQLMLGNSLYVCTWDQVLFARDLTYLVYMHNSSMVRNQCLCYWFSLMVLILTFLALF